VKISWTLRKVGWSDRSRETRPAKGLRGAFNKETCNLQAINAGTQPKAASGILFYSSCARAYPRISRRSSRGKTESLLRDAFLCSCPELYSLPVSLLPLPPSRSPTPWSRLLVRFTALILGKTCASRLACNFVSNEPRCS